MIALEYSDLRDTDIRLPFCTKEQYKKEAHMRSNSTRSLIQTHSGSHFNINFKQHTKIFISIYLLYMIY